ncbi:MAG: lytic murein transglycosylase [Solirubrobacteraceae bacterium]
MKTRKLITSLVVTGALSVGLGSSLSPASGLDRCEIKDPPPDPLLCPNAAANLSATAAGPNTATTPGANTTQQTTEAPPPTPQPTVVTPPARRPADAAPRKTKAQPKKKKKDEEQTQNQANQPRAAAPTNPGFALSVPGPAAIGVPNFFIEKFRIPPFLLPIYQAAGTEYGVPWQVLAAINEIETDYGRNLNVSSAGAMGWMQFIPSSWKTYGLDANDDGRKDPYNPVDAIFAAARYLKAAGAETNLRQAIFSYNHAGWYVDSVMLRAKLIGGLPDDLVGALTGLTQGHFPVAARATYTDGISKRQLALRTRSGNAAMPVGSSPTRRGINIYSRRGAPVIAVNDGIIKKVGFSQSLGHYVVLQDVYGNVYTYAKLGRVAPSYPAPKPRPLNATALAKTLDLPPRDPKPLQPATAGRQPAAFAKTATRSRHGRGLVRPAPLAKERLFAHPGRPSSYRAGGEEQLLQSGKPVAGYTTFQAYFKQVLGLDRKDVVLRKLKPGAQVIGGTILGRIDKTTSLAPHVSFSVRPAGPKSPAVDPKPILDGWKLLESTAIYRAAGKNPFFGPDARNPTIGQILLLSKEALERRVLADPRINIYGCGRRDVQAGQIDRRVLATIEFLTSAGLKPTITSLKCGHSFYTKGGTVSEHSSGDAVDIAAVNGIPIAGHQGAGSITDITIRRLLTLQGIMKPHQIISLMTFEGASNTLAMSDHADHIHVGFQPLFGANGKLGQQFNAVLKPDQWVKLVNRLNEIDNPVVPVKPSKAAIPVSTTSSRARHGE